LFRYALIFLILVSQSLFAAQNTEIKDKTHFKNSPFENISYNKSDRRFGLLLFEFNKLLKKGKISRSLSLNLSRTYKSTTAFPTFSTIIPKINKIRLISLNLKSFSKSCSVEEINNSELSPIALRTKLNLEKYCRRLFIKILSKESKKSSIQFIGLDYLKKNINYYLSGESHDLFVKYLKKINKNLTLHKLLSELITDNYIQGQLTPRKQVLSHLTISPKLTTYVQEVGLGNNQARSYFNSEFKILTSAYKRSLNNKNYIEANSHIENLLSFHSENSIYISQRKAWTTFISAGKKFLGNNQGKTAEKLFRYAQKIAIGDQVNESNFQLLWRHIYLNDYMSANNIIEEFKMVENFSKFGSKVKFWVSYTLLKIGEDDLSEHLFVQLTKFAPLNFYTIIALKTLNNLKEKKQHKNVKAMYQKKAPELLLTQKSLSPKLISALKRLHLWLDLHYDKYSSLEVNKIVAMDKSIAFKDKSHKDSLKDGDVKKYLISSLIKLFNQENKYLHTFKLLHKSLDNKVFDLNAMALKHLFPSPYMGKIKKMSGEIDPFVILSLIRQESAFNPEAKSGVGARGLMQLMPATARQYSYKRLKISRLKKPDLNIKIGVKYFKKLLKQFDGNLIYALASYNAGENRVKRWKKSIFRSENPLQTIESIPFKETRKYVKLIYRNIFFYNLLSEKSTLAAPLEDSFHIGYYKKGTTL
jgi:soluble lytic murein transglycosylase